MKIPFLGSVVPAHVLCLLEEGVTYARVRSETPSGFEESRHFRYPAGPFAQGSHVRLTREALSESVRPTRGRGSSPSSSRRCRRTTTRAARWSPGS